MTKEVIVISGFKNREDLLKWVMLYESHIEQDDGFQQEGVTSIVDMKHYGEEKEAFNSDPEKDIFHLKLVTR